MSFFIISVLVNNSDNTVSHYPQLISASNEEESRGIALEYADNKYPKQTLHISPAIEITMSILTNIVSRLPDKELNELIDSFLI